MPEDVSYRPAGPEDVPALVALVARCDASHADWAPAGWEPPLSDPDVDAARLRERLTDPEHVIVVAQAGGKVAGFATVRPGDSAGRGHLSNLFVDPPFWGRGIGRGLLARAVEAMRGRGYTTGELSTQVGNARARGLYERAGWRDTGGRHPNAAEGLEMAEYEIDIPAVL